jgi:hypothetical protein
MMTMGILSAFEESPLERGGVAEKRMGSAETEPTTFERILHV